MTPTELASLEALAKAARPEAHKSVADWTVAMGRFQLAANPAAILSLIEENKRMREALGSALPYVETLHSLVSKGSAARAQVWAVVKEIRAALEPQS